MKLDSEMRVRILAMFGIALAICNFIYGAVFFSDAPYHGNDNRSCGITAVFCGKTNHPHSMQDFKAFSVWQMFFFFSIPLLMLCACILQATAPIWSKQTVRKE